MHLPPDPSVLDTLLLNAATSAARPISADTAAVLERLSPQTERAKRRIAELRAGTALTIFTGQQLGLMLGPTYTLFKIASAIALAETLEHKLGRSVIPVFWLQSDDHDFDEVRYCELPDTTDGLVRIELPPDAEPNRISVGLRKLGPEIRPLMERFSLRVQPAWQEKAMLERAYSPELTFRESFAEVVRTVFRESDLLLYDSQAPEAKREAGPFFLRVLEKSDSIDAALAQRSRLLTESGEKEQVAVRSGSPLFFVHFPTQDGPRYRLQRRGEHFQTIGGDITISRIELERIVAEEPARISTSALLRPILQDSLFPVLSYVGGDAELRYLQQIPEVYTILAVRPALPIRRMSAYIIEPRSKRLLTALNLSAQDIIFLSDEVESQLRGGAPSAEQLSRELTASAQSFLTQVRQSTSIVEGEMEKVLRRADDKLTRTVSGVLARYRTALENRHDATSNRYRKLLELLFPRDIPQERVFCSFYWVAKYGEPFVSRILQEARTWCETPGNVSRIIELGD